MAKSLQEQLLQAGLVNAHKAKQIQHEKQKRGRHSDDAVADDAKRLARQAQEEKAKRDREANLRQQLEAERLALAAQLKQWVEQERVDYGGGDVLFQFVENNKVKRLYVSSEQRSQLLSGTLAVVKCAKRYELVHAKCAEKIRERFPEAVVVLNSPESQQGGADAADPYAAYQVPDDLIW